MKLLIIGLDGGTWDVLGPLCDWRVMPHLAALRARGAWGTLLSTQPPFTAPAWASFVTGMNPGKHGVLHFIQTDSPAAMLRGDGQPVHSQHIRAPLLWEYFHAYGRTTAVLNMPMSYPLRPVRGFAISGMLTPPDVRDWVYPPDLARDLQGYIIDLSYGRPGRPLRREDLPSPLEMLEDVLLMTERRGVNALRLMQTRPWDAFMVVFTGTDRLFHHFWHYLDPTRKESASKLHVRIADQLHAYFELLDQILGALVKNAGPETYIVLLSDHGFGPAARHWVHLNNWLLELGLLHLRGSKAGWMQRLKRTAPWITDMAKRILPAEARQAVKQHGSLADAMDWSSSLAWAVPLYNNVAGIYLREGASVELVELLREQAQALQAPGSSRPLVQKIQTRDQVYQGPYTPRFPHLILTLDPDYAAVPTLGSTLITPIPPGMRLRSGDHRPEGLFLAAGPGLRAGHLLDAPHIMDVAPTLLHLTGLPIPSSMDGKLMEAIFDPHWLLAHPPRQGPDLPPPPPPAALSAEEQEAIADRLRGLGYLE